MQRVLHRHSRHFREQTARSSARCSKLNNRTGITVSRILNIETGPQGVKVDRGFVAVESIPIGIDVQTLRAKACAGSALVEVKEASNKRTDGRRIS